MKQWAILYEYCSEHPNCEDSACQRTILIHSSPNIPELNLLATKFIEEIRPKTVPVISDKPPKAPPKPTLHAASSVFRKNLIFRMPIPMNQFLGLMLLGLGLGGALAPFTQNIRLESSYLADNVQMTVKSWIFPTRQLPKSVPVVFEPLMTPDGASIAPVNKDFSLVIPKIGVNSNIIADVDPANPAKYEDALQHGIAHASTSFFPDQDGTVYLFSHSTNYDWFVKDLNAVFYLVKNLDHGDTMVLFYKGKEYTYIVTDKKIVSPSDTSYLVPVVGHRTLILQTCWPPGSTSQRLLIFADMIQDGGLTI